ncbi:hypothetical protein DFQ26_001804 [Actinomortierella ambigua]|nr:hypothetical protein DFQ26_001804 [Actinomortierella ambigua]
MHPHQSHPHQSHPHQSHHLPERPFEERPLPSRGDHPVGYYFVGDPRQSFVSSSSQGVGGSRPLSAATFAGSPASIDPYTVNTAGLPRPVSNQRLSTISGATAVHEPLSMASRAPPPPSSIAALSHLPSGHNSSNIPMAEVSPEGGYIKPPPSMIPGSQQQQQQHHHPHHQNAEPWGVVASPVTASGVTDGLLYKNPQLYPDKDAATGGINYVMVPISSSAGVGGGVVYDPSMHPYHQQTTSSGPLSSTMFSPTMSNTASTASSSTPLVGHPTTGQPPAIPPRTSFSGPLNSLYHDGTSAGGAGYVKVPLLAMDHSAQPAPGQAFHNPQLYVQGGVLAGGGGGGGGQGGADLVGDPRRASNPQGNNGYGAMLS